MIYNLITETINDYLGGDYVLEYANNHDVNWNTILPESQDKIKYGVLRVDSGTTQQIGGNTIRTEQLRLIVAIPEDREIFNAAVVNLRTMLNGLNNESINDSEESTTAILTFGEYHDAQSQTVNGQKWWVAEVTFIVNFYSSFYDYTDRSVAIKISGASGTATTIGGIIQTTYLCEKTFDPNTYNGNRNTFASCNGVKVTLQITLVYLKTDTTITSMLSHEDDLTTFEVVYSNGTKTRTYPTMIIASVSETVVTGDVLKATITFTPSA